MKVEGGVGFFVLFGVKVEIWDLLGYFFSVFYFFYDYWVSYSLNLTSAFKNYSLSYFS